MERELVEDIVIVGAGIAGLTTSLGLHRYLFHFLRSQTIFLCLHHYFMFHLYSQVGHLKFGVGIFGQFEGHWLCFVHMAKCLEGFGCCRCRRHPPPPTSPAQWVYTFIHTF